jgi:hypothetical protein
MRTHYTAADFESWAADDLADWDYTAEPTPSQFRVLEDQDLPQNYSKPQAAFPKTITVDEVEYAQTLCEEDMYGCYYAQYHNSNCPNQLYELIN